METFVIILDLSYPMTESLSAKCIQVSKFQSIYAPCPSWVVSNLSNSFDTFLISSKGH